MTEVILKPLEIREGKFWGTTTLNQEFDLFRMKQGESVSDMEMRFVHLINRLNALDKPVSNEITTKKF